MSAARVVVVGLGNRLRGDDAVGPLVADRLAGRTPPGVTVLSHEGDPTDLLEVWDGADLCVVVDAVWSGSAPGTLHRVEPLAGPLRTRLDFPSSHGFDLPGTVALARVLGRLPRRLVVLGVEAAGFDRGAALSPPVAAALPAAVDAMLAEIDPWLG
ncbi:MAG TPA: hydrogenase maturation protease [Thermomicrobiaceae bacterium]|nr:hydrogenase maturation protease [Thermomicrobiaceae bacterium]